MSSAYLDFKAFQEIIRGPSVRLLLIVSVESIKSETEKESSEQDLRIWYKYGQPESMTLTFYTNCRRKSPKQYVEASGEYLPHTVMLRSIPSMSTRIWYHISCGAILI